MTDHEVAVPPPIQNERASGQRRALKYSAALGGAGLVFLALMAFAGSPEIEVSKTAYNAIRILNTGTKPITITKITINDRDDCPARTDHQETDYWNRVLSSQPLNPDNDKFSGSTLQVGDRTEYTSTCRIVRAAINTDQGSETYTFSGN